MNARSVPMISAHGDGVRLRLRVQPGASRSAFAGPYGDSLKIAVKAPPVDGKANEALIEFLANAFSLPKRDVSLIAGEASRDKSVLLQGITLAEAQRILAEKAGLG